MKIIMLSFLKLEDLPPIVSLIKSASSLHEIVYIGVNDSSEYYQSLFGKNVSLINIDYTDSIRKLARKYRVARILTNRLRRYAQGLFAEKVLQKYYEEGDLIWVLHEYTLNRLCSNFFERPFCLTMYELSHNLLRLEETKFKKRVKRAAQIVVPEYCRAAIVQACLGLKDMPYILPNKPFDYSEEAIALDENPLKQIADVAHSQGKQVVLYSGIYLRERKLDTIIEAVLRQSDRYEMVLIGQELPYLKELLQTYPAVKYAGFTKAPKHLSMIQYADIGILTYVADSGSINPVFCAPNKTWEYALFGIPMLCNDIPGLRYTVEYNKMGLCCDIQNVDDIAQKLQTISDNYTEMSQAASAYYRETDIQEIVNNIVADWTTREVK